MSDIKGLWLFFLKNDRFFTIYAKVVFFLIFEKYTFAVENTKKFLYFLIRFTQIKTLFKEKVNV